jgi:polyhydroxyalkanoate synthesis regulator phasin
MVSKRRYNMDNRITEGLKTLLLAGVGAAALTVDKSQEILKDLVDRGELTVEQGKALNQELKHKIQAVKEQEEPQVAEEHKKDDFANLVAGLSPEDLAALKEQILKAETKDE